MILNFARDVLVNSEDIVDALVGGKVGRYVTDFPTPEIAGVKHAIVIPHLGASTAGIRRQLCKDGSRRAEGFPGKWKYP